MATATLADTPTAPHMLGGVTTDVGLNNSSSTPRSSRLPSLPGSPQNDSQRNSEMREPLSSTLAGPSEKYDQVRQEEAVLPHSSPTALDPQMDHEPHSFFHWGRMDNMTAWRSRVFFLVYFPVGIVLAVARLCMIPTVFLLMSLFKSNAKLCRRLFRFLTTVCLGFRIKINGAEHLVDEDGKWKSDAKICVANHISENDIFPIAYLTPVSVVAHHKFSIFENYFFSLWTSGLFKHAIRPIYTNVSSSKPRTDVREAVQKTLEQNSMPLLVFPEGALTNGSGLLMFHKYVFSEDVGHPVTPITLATSYPIPLAMDTVYASSKMNFIWRMFVPYQDYEMTVLEPTPRLAHERDTDYARRVQTAIANDLKIHVTPFSNRDKYALIEATPKSKKERMRRNGSNASGGRPRRESIGDIESQRGRVNPVSVHAQNSYHEVAGKANAVLLTQPPSTREYTQTYGAQPVGGSGFREAA